ncbi:MAG: PAS domain S-box protein [Syntrophorhabdales bacterium]|jgi:PAS domain S-box-containing protein
MEEKRSKPTGAYQPPDRGKQGGLFRIPEEKCDSGKRAGEEHALPHSPERHTMLAMLLRESEDRYKALVERSNDGIAMVRGERLIYANPRYCEIFGYKNAIDASSRPVSSLVHPEERERVVDLIERKAKGEHGPSRLEFRALRGDGRIVHIESSVAKTVFQGETVLLLLLRDVSERKAIEDERRRLALIVDRAAEMILMTDKAGVVQYANGAFLQNRGKKWAEVIGGRLLDCATEDDIDFYEGLYARIQRERKWNGRMTLKGRDGRFCELDVSISTMRDPSGDLASNVIVCRDVTAEAMLEMQLRQAHKMEAIGTLAGGIAHDFNNILAGIIGNAELALDEAPDGSPMQHNLEQIFKAGNRGKDLVKQILAFSRADQQEPVLVEAGPLVTETMKLLRSSIPATIDVRHHVEPGRDTVLAEAGRLQQILMNLCANAAHAMREKGGVLDVVVREYQLSQESGSPPGLEPGPYLIISVSDSGHGMNEAVMERIFDPFFTTKRPGEGTGMGLAVVHGIVKSLKGAITVRSQPGTGSTFSVYLPIVAGEMVRTVREENRPLLGGKERILFVDDEKPIVEMNTMLLERLGYRVTALSSSAAALDLFMRSPDAFDLVITDQIMPDFTGTDLTKKIRSIRKDIPIILITGFSEVIDWERAKKLGINHILMKPIVRRELADAIRNLLDK